MKLSVKVEYACRVLAHMARLHEVQELAHIESLAEAEAVPPNYLVQILSELREGGLILSRRGKQGGYQLARPPERISLLDIVEAIEGGILEFGELSSGQSGGRIREVWEELRDLLAARAREVTLEQMRSGPRESMWFI